MTVPNLEPQLLQLQSLIDSNTSPEVAKSYQESLKEKQQFLNDKHHPVYFIGPVGIGKSSLIGIASRLLTDATPPVDRNSLRLKSVLATGSGRTTVCEVRVMPALEDGDNLVLRIEPLEQTDMEQEIRLYAEEVWDRKNGTKSPDLGNVGQEVYRFIRNMTGYSDNQESYTDEAGLRKRRTVRPFEEAAANFAERREGFVQHMLQRADLSQRIKTEWHIASMAELKALFERINHGDEREASLPERIEVWLPDTLPGSGSGFDVTLVDTRGLDGGIESRADLQECLQDSRALFVLCSTFNDAPSDAVRGVLQAMNADLRLRPALKRCVLLLVDQDNAVAVNDAQGDREYGQELKVAECLRAMESLKLEESLKPEQILAFDALKDDRLRLVQKLDRQLLDLRDAEAKSQTKLREEVQKFIQNASEGVRPALQQELLSEIKKVLATTLVNMGDDSPPLSDPLAGAYAAIEASHPASRVYASVRRAGRFRNLDIYAAIRSAASAECSAWLLRLLNPVLRKLGKLQSDPQFALVEDIVQRYRREYLSAGQEVLDAYVKSINEELKNLLWRQVIQDKGGTTAKLWQACIAEWGQGDGYKTKVVDHLRNWARKQNLRAHETTIAMEKIPFLRDVTPPVLPFSFTLKVDNLRALKHVNWAPADVALLIGANGAGKTTLLKVLRLLRMVYETSLPDAVKIVFGGSHNLRHWQAGSEEPISISLEMDQSCWTFELLSSEGSAVAVNERFTHKNEEIFSRNGLGSLMVDGKPVDGDEKFGLRTLLETGVKRPALSKFAQFLKGIHYFADPDLPFFRKNGSYTEDDQELQVNGGNALTMLRSWMQDLSNKHRFEFVLNGLRDAFPRQIADLDFKEAGKTLVARIYHPSQPTIPVPLEDEANGLLQMLILLCAVANAKPRSLVAIDEPENSLHPYATRAFLRQASIWARKHHITILLATHSIVLLDEFDKQHDHVWVMKEKDQEHGGGGKPTRLDQLYDPDWLDCYRLGDLFERDELVSNED